MAKEKQNNKQQRIPQKQKIPLQKKQSVGYSQKYSQKKSYAPPKNEESYSPLPKKGNNKAESANPLFQANPLPSLYENGARVETHYSQENEVMMSQPESAQISNYNYHNHQARNVGGQPHEIKKANFEQNRRSHISNVSSNIVSSREKRNSEMGDSGFNKVSHSKNTNKGFVRMTTGPQKDISRSTNNINAQYKVDSVPYQGEPTPTKNTNMQSVNKVKEAKNLLHQRKKAKDSILQQYSQNLPPHQVEYKSGFQEIPEPTFNMGEEQMYFKSQAKPLPGNTDLADIEYYRDVM